MNLTKGFLLVRVADHALLAGRSPATVGWWVAQGKVDATKEHKSRPRRVGAELR
jgi:hypothetical protein